MTRIAGPKNWTEFLYSESKDLLVIIFSFVGAEIWHVDCSVFGMAALKRETPDEAMALCRAQTKEVQNAE